MGSLNLALEYKKFPNTSWNRYFRFFFKYETSLNYMFKNILTQCQNVLRSFDTFVLLFGGKFDHSENAYK
jgi:hypothetical protein